MNAVSVRLERATAATSDIRELIAELDQELAGSYALEQRHGLSLNAIFQPHIRFFVARTQDGVQGCGDTMQNTSADFSG